MHIEWELQIFSWQTPMWSESDVQYTGSVTKKRNWDKNATGTQKKANKTKK